MLPCKKKKILIETGTAFRREGHKIKKDVMLKKLFSVHMSSLQEVQDEEHQMSEDRHCLRRPIVDPMFLFQLLLR